MDLKNTWWADVFQVGNKGLKEIFKVYKEARKATILCWHQVYL